MALVVIARDAQETIGRLLHSVMPWVDLSVVVDTGSSDDTGQAALRCGAQLHHLPWPDDFSAARNAALKIAAADWHLVLDADEWLIEGGEFLHQLRRAPANSVGQIQLLDMDDTGPESHAHTATARSWLSRLLPGHVRYEGRIHEQPIHRLPVFRTPLVVGHDGYRPQALAAKRGRNRRLLEAELRDHPHDPYVLYQLGKDADVYEDYSMAARRFSAAWQSDQPSGAWRVDLLVRWIGALKRLGRHPEAAALILEANAEMNESPDFHFAVGDLMLDWAATAPQEAATLLAKAESAWRRCLSLGERPEQSGSVAGRGSHLAAFNLALILEGTDRPAEAAKLRREFGLSTAPILG